MLCKDLREYLENIYPTESSLSKMDFCPNGLQVEGKENLKHIGFAVTASEKVIYEAITKKMDALIVHHGLFWKSPTFVCRGSSHRKLKMLIDNQVALWAYHLPMDAHEVMGNNWPVARDLGLIGIKGFGSYKNDFLGVKGHFKQPKSSVEVLEKIEQIYGVKELAFAGSHRNIERVAIISGGGHKYFEEALFEDIDLFITGTRDEPQWNMAFENNALFCPLGHRMSETIGPKRLMMKINQDYPNLRLSFIEENNPY